MRATAAFHAQFWRALDWKNILLLLVALCIIGFDLVGRVKVHQRSLGHSMQRAEASVSREGQVARPTLRRLRHPQASVSWETVPIESSFPNDAETLLESSPPPGFVVTRVAPVP